MFMLVNFRPAGGHYEVLCDWENKSHFHTLVALTGQFEVTSAVRHALRLTNIFTHIFTIREAIHACLRAFIAIRALRWAHCAGHFTRGFLRIALRTLLLTRGALVGTAGRACLVICIAFVNKDRVLPVARFCARCVTGALVNTTSQQLGAAVLTLHVHDPAHIRTSRARVFARIAREFATR